MKPLFIALAFAAWGTVASAYEDRVIDAARSPIKLENYRATHDPGSGSYPREAVVHRVRVTNTSDKKIAAYKIGFLAYDAFKERLGRGLQGYSIETIEPGAYSDAGWNHTVLEAGLFKRYGMGIAYASKVRFEDGSIWEADLTQILRHLRDIEEDISVDDLAQKKD